MPVLKKHTENPVIFCALANLNYVRLYTGRKHQECGGEGGEGGENSAGKLHLKMEDTNEIRGHI